MAELLFIKQKWIAVDRLIKKVPPEAERKTFYNVAAQIFSDGVFNWGRVVALFYFAYKVCIKVSSFLQDTAKGEPNWKKHQMPSR